MSSWDFLTSAPNSNTWPYSIGWDVWPTGPKNNPYGYCTFYCYMRSGQVTGYYMPNNVAPTPTATGVYGEPASWRTDGVLAAGNIVVCTGHVMFIEDVNGDTVTLSDSYYSFYEGTFKNLGAPFTRTKNQLKVGTNLGHPAGRILGYSSNPKGEDPSPPTPPPPDPDPPPPDPDPDPSGGYWEFDHRETISINLTDCNDMFNPIAPSLNDILEYYGIYITSNGQYREPSGVINNYTFERQIQYQSKRSGTWPDWPNTAKYNSFNTQWDD